MNDNVRVAIIFGTRPEAIKLSPLISEFKKESGFVVTVIDTGQHEELTSEQDKVVGFSSDISLGVMKKGSLLIDLSDRLLHNIGRTLQAISPDFVIVQGDTASAMFGALSAFHLDIPIAHVEAGLRTYDTASPYPEEGYRRIISSLAKWHFCPSERAANNLNQEKVGGNVFVTGNTVVDALQLVLLNLASDKSAKQFSSKNLVLATIHRRENTPYFPRIFLALKQIAEWEDVDVLITVHPNPNVRNAIQDWLKDSKVQTVPPMNYLSWVKLMSHANLIISDSGGIQEEASILGVPLLITRQNTERPEVIDGHYGHLAGVETQDIVKLSRAILNGEIPCKRGSPYGDGTASQKIVGILRKHWCLA